MKQLFPFSINEPQPKAKIVSSSTNYGYIDGDKDILDLSLGSCGSFPIGFKRTDIIDHVTNELKHTSFCQGDFATTNDAATELSERLFNISNGFYSLYSMSGSDAIEGAVKLAQMYHHGNKNKNKIIGFNKAYHGSTFMSTSVGGNQTMINYFGRHHECINISYEEIEEHIDEHTRAVFIETMSWGNSLNPLPKEFYSRLRELCDKYDALLIVDDIAFCGGKTGTILGYQSTNLQPDIVTLGKGISGGYFPLAVTMCNQKVADIVKPQFLLHGFTYSFPMPGIFSTLKYLDILEEENILASHNKVVEMGKSVMTYLKDKNLITEYNSFGTCFSFNTNYSNLPSHEREQLFYNNGLHLGIWNNNLSNILVMTPIIPDAEYFNSLKTKLENTLVQYQC